MSGLSTAPTTSSQAPLPERINVMASGQTPQQLSGLALQPNPIQPQTPPMPSSGDKEKEGESAEGRQTTAIFRPDDAGEWREKLRLSHEASEQARLAREGQNGSIVEVNSWDRREDDEDVKEDESEVADDDSSVGSEGEGTKVWKAKRTLRKLVVIEVTHR